MPVDKPLSPAAFADAWTARYARALQEAAGRDGRLTKAAGERMGERADEGREAADDVVAFFARTGQKTASVPSFLAAQRRHVVDAAAAVAGPNQRLSLVEARALPVELRGDYAAVRGRPTSDVAGAPVDDGPRPLEGEPLRAAVVAQVRAFFAAGPDGKLAAPPWQVRGRRPVVESVVDGATGLRAEVFVAAGRTFASIASSAPSPHVGWYDVGPAPTAPVDVAATLRAAVERAAEGLWHTSESDAPYRFAYAANPARRAVSPELVRELFAPAHDALAQDVFGPGTSLPPLAGRAVEVRDAAEWLSRLEEVYDPADPVAVENARRFGALRRTLEDAVRDLVVVRFGDDLGAGRVGGAISTFVVGTTADGDVAGLFTGAVET